MYEAGELSHVDKSERLYDYSDRVFVCERERCSRKPVDHHRQI